MDQDDLFEDKPRYTPRQAATMKEMERRAQDRIRVFNPTTRDFIVMWDSVKFLIPNKLKDNGQGNGQAVLPRYIALNYAKKMLDKILGERMVIAILTENKRRENHGMNKMNYYEDRVNFDVQYKVSDENARNKLRKIVWLGIEEEYGMDIQEDMRSEQQMERTEEEALMELDQKAKRLAGDSLPQVPNLEVTPPVNTFSSFTPSFETTPPPERAEVKQETPLPRAEVLPIDASLQTPLTQEQRTQMAQEVQA